jgi:hypothetical protein
MDAAVSTRCDNASSTAVDTVADLFFEIALVLAQVHFNRQATLTQQFTDARCALTGTAATGGWIEEQVDGLDGH